MKRVKKSHIARNIDKDNQKHKADVELRRCLKCNCFDKTIYKCKEEKCINTEKIWK